jgi:predicted RNase H-like nuclease (RuvC/YqgF family)
VNKSQAIQLLQSEGWTQADAKRALELINFNTNPDEITIRRAISSFTGSELSNRQRLQAAQKGMVTKKNKEIESKIEQLNKSQKQEREKYEAEIKSLEMQLKSINSENNELLQLNDQLKKDNKSLKNLVDAIKLRLAIDTKRLLEYEDSKIRQALIKMFKSTLG